MSEPAAESPAPPSSSRGNICVFLLQLGGPKDQAGIKPFLKNLFADVLPGPKWVRNRLGKFIAWRRTPKVAPLYAAIGGGSPLLANTQAQADALTARLVADGYTPHCYIVMRYAPPRLHEALVAARALGDEVPWVALPLYPHYSYATTRSSMMEMSPELTAEERARLILIDAYPTDPDYLRAAVSLIRLQLDLLLEKSRDTVHLVFSAHGLPLKLVREGDPYPEHVEQTVKALYQQLGTDFPFILSYQSRVGPIKWLTPSTSDTLARLGREGVKRVLVVPVSFVSEHIETLHELDIELRDEAKEAGIVDYVRASTVGAAPDFITALAAQVERGLKQGPPGFKMGDCICDPRRFGKRCLCA